MEEGDYEKEGDEKNADVDKEEGKEQSLKLALEAAMGLRYNRLHFLSRFK